MSEWIVRTYAREDRRAVRDVAVANAWLGGPGGEAIPDPWIWAELVTRYFTDREPENTWVVAREGGLGVAGFLAGTTDVAKLEKYLPRLVPGIFVRATTRALLLRRAPRRAAASMIRSLLIGELVVPPKVRLHFPATFRFAMSGEARGHGLGAKLLERYLDRMRSLDVPGVHVQALAANEELARFLQRAGFQLAASWPVTAFAHVEAQPIDLLTWVLPLSKHA